MIELGTLLAGPFAGRMLGDLGAEIIKVEPPGQPDPIREWGKARYKGRSLWWPVQSRNKKCVTLNLRAERGQELLLRLVEKADVVTENFRPGHAREMEPRLRPDVRGQPRHRPRADLGIRADGPVLRARRLRLGLGGDGRASGTSTASRARRRRACTSRSATRWRGCSPPRGSSRRSTGATRRRRARPGGRCLVDGGRPSPCSRAPCPSTTGSASSAGPRERI